MDKGMTILFRPSAKYLTRELNAKLTIVPVLGIILFLMLPLEMAFVLLIIAITLFVVPEIINYTTSYEVRKDGFLINKELIKEQSFIRYNHIQSIEEYQTWEDDVAKLKNLRIKVMENSILTKRSIIGLDSNDANELKNALMKKLKK